jgi:membrane-associated phospholipid phosphatase
VTSSDRATNHSPAPPTATGPAPRPVSRTQRVVALVRLVWHRHWQALLVLVCAVTVPLWLVGLLATEVFGDDGYDWDTALLRFAHSHASPGLDRIVVAITHLGGWAVLLPATALAVGLAAWRRSYRTAVFLALAVGGATLVNLLAKGLFQRARPALWESVAPETTWSFPSGHSMGSMAFALAVCLLAWSTRMRWPGVGLLVLLPTLVGASRVYLGVHYPSDVLAGWLASTAWVSGVALFVLRPRRRTPAPSTADRRR